MLVAQVWGFANVGFNPGKRLWDEVARNSINTMHDFSPQNIANCAICPLASYVAACSDTSMHPVMTCNICASLHACQMSGTACSAVELCQDGGEGRSPARCRVHAQHAHHARLPAAVRGAQPLSADMSAGPAAALLSSMTRMSSCWSLRPVCDARLLLLKLWVLVRPIFDRSRGCARAPTLRVGWQSSWELSMHIPWKPCAEMSRPHQATEM